MTRPAGRKGQQLLAYVLRRDRGICWLCGRVGADTMDHVLPLRTHPHLSHDPRNLRAAHGERRTIGTHGYDCEGNYARRDRPPPTDATHSRKW